MTCATCRHALPVQSTVTGFAAHEYRHCALAAIAVRAWLIGKDSGCAHRPSKWSQATTAPL